jgi:RNA polymerase sigma-70 factor (sigma-E family)
MELRQREAAIETGGLLAGVADIERDHEVAELFRRHYAPMCRLAYVILGDASTAEEVVMEALVKTYSGWRRIKDLSKSEAYLRQAVVNGCRSKIRRKGVEARAAAVIRQRVQEQVGGWDDDRRETSREMWKLVTALPERQRACVVLYYYEDLPEGEIADLLGCSVGTVKSQLFKARAKLQKQLNASEDSV